MKIFRFSSCKFFKLISRDKRNARVMKRCNYMGPMTAKQMSALFSALKDFEVHETATIGNIHLNQKYKLKDVVRLVDDIDNNNSYVHNVWENLNYGEHTVRENP